MKQWVLLPIAFLFSFQTSFASTTNLHQESILLTYQQFMSLTQAEQLTYVKRLREMVLEMNEQNPNLAAQLEQKSTLFAQLWSMSFQEARGDDPPAPSGGVNLGNISTDEAKQIIEITLQNANDYSKAVADKIKAGNLSDQDKGMIDQQYQQSLYYAKIASYIAHNTIKDTSIRDKVIQEQLTPALQTIQSNETSLKTAIPQAKSLKNADSFIAQIKSGENADHTTVFSKQDLVPYGDPIKPVALTPDTPAKGKKAKNKKAKDDSDTAAAPAVKTDTKPKDKSSSGTTVTGNIPSEKDTPGRLAPAGYGGSSPSSSGDTPGRLAPAGYGGSAPTAADKASEQKHTGEIVGGIFYRCMYSGFVIKDDPCMAPKTLPWELKGLDSKNFTCSGGLVLCNPLVFGVQTKCDWNNALEKDRTKACWDGAKPYCVKKGKFPTKDCAELSQNDGSLQAAAELIRNNPDVYKQFAKSFDELCNKNMINLNGYGNKKRSEASKQYIKNDIEVTCAVARERMDDVKKKYPMAADTSSTSANTKAAPPAAKNAKPASAPAAPANTTH